MLDELPIGLSMSIEVDATYENGVLKPDRPLPLEEHQRVKVVVELKRPGSELGLGRGDDDAGRIIAKLPGADDARE